ncbi:MAG TPA: WD40 repeat domain-containing protein [Pyrinomonadaceae bacterium]|nr:WD40 repeat domain-containing protein [Pyrinomonadaceae bacterium]
MNLVPNFDPCLPRKLAAVLTAFFAATATLYSQVRRPGQVTALTDVVNAMQFSPDGRLLAIARGSRGDYRVDLWDTESGNLVRTIKGFDGTVWSVSFAPDGKTLVTGSGGVHPEKIAAKPSARNGRRFAELKWWDPLTGDLKHRLELTDEDLVSLAAVYSPDGQSLSMVVNRVSRAMVLFGSLGSMAPLGTDPISRSTPIRALTLESDLKILNALTGELQAKLKDGFASSQFPFFPGMSGLDILSMFPRQPLRPLIFSPDGRLVAGWNPGEIRLWQSSTGAEALKIKKFKGRVNAIAFSPDGQLLAAAIVQFSIKNNQRESKSELHIWDVATGAPRQVLPLATPVISSLLFANSGQQLFVSGLQNEDNQSHACMELVDLQAGSRGKLIARNEGTMSSIAVSPDGAIMAFQTDASTVKLLETQNWRTKHTIGGDDPASSSGALRRFLVTVKSVTAVAFLPDGKNVVGEIENEGIRLWDPRTGEAKKTLTEEGEIGSTAEISQSGAIAAEITADEAVRLWSIGSGEHRVVPLGNSKARAIGLSGNGEILAIDCGDEIVLLNAGDLKTRRTLAGFKDKVTHLALSVDGGLLAVSTADGAVNIWNASDGSPRQVSAAGREVSALRFEPQNRMLAVAWIDGTVLLWDLENKAPSFENKKHQGPVNAIAFSQDGRLMATGGDDRIAIIWEVALGKARRNLKGHDLAITSLAFSPDGHTLAVGSGNASVVLWDVARGKLDRVLK